MWGRRVVYLLGLVSGTVFFLAYKQWASFLVLLVILILPWLSLLLSLPAMLTAKVSLRCAGQVQRDTPVRTTLQVSSRFPAPPVKSKVRLRNVLTGERYVGLPGERVPTHQCGKMALTWDEIYIYDYLGLFRRRIKEGQGCEIYIFPKLVKTPIPKAQSDGLVHAWRAKPGGGFSENRELRLYRPGDSLRHIHWKLTAKVGKPIYAEPIEPVQKGYLLSVCLTGDLDDKLGRLSYVSRYLLGQGSVHKILCRTQEGTVEFTVENPKDFEQGMCRILSARPVENEETVVFSGALWHHHIGGGTNEA